MRLALLEAKMTLIEVLTKYRLVRSTETEVCMHVCTYACLYVCMYVCMYANDCTVGYMLELFVLGTVEDLNITNSHILEASL